MSDTKGASPRILLQLDGDPQPSVFDAVVAVDAGVEHLFRHGSVTPEAVRDLVYGAIFTRGGDALSSTAIFVGGSDVRHGESLLQAAVDSFLGPLRVSVMFDANGANTTAAAAVLAAARHLELAKCKAAVLGGTGPVGQRAALLLASAGADVVVGSRSVDRALAVCENIRTSRPGAKLTPHATSSIVERQETLRDAQLVIAAGAAGARLLSADELRAAETLEVAIDLNAVPPVGLEGIESTARGDQVGSLIGYGAIGVGSTKMKIHKAAIRQLYQAHDQVLDAQEIFAIGQRLEAN